MNALYRTLLISTHKTASSIRAQTTSPQCCHTNRNCLSMLQAALCSIMIVTAYPKMQQPTSTLFGFFVRNPISTNKIISGVFEEIFPLQLLTLLLTQVFYVARRNVVPKTQILARPTILMPWCGILREHTVTAINEVRYKEITLAFVTISLRDRGGAAGAACGGMFCQAVAATI